MLLLLLFVHYLYSILKVLKHEALLRQKTLIYHNKISLQHLLKNKLNTEYFTFDKFNDIFNIAICFFTYV